MKAAVQLHDTKIFNLTEPAIKSLAKSNICSSLPRVLSWRHYLRLPSWRRSSCLLFCQKVR